MQYLHDEMDMFDVLENLERAMTVLNLVPEPTFADEVRASVVQILSEALAQAKDGKITSVVVIALHPDGSWSDWQSSTEQVSATIGRLEIAKQKRIQSCLT